MSASPPRQRTRTPRKNIDGLRTTSCCKEPPPPSGCRFPPITPRTATPGRCETRQRPSLPKRQNPDPAASYLPSLRGANGSRECAPDDRLRDEAIHNLSYPSLDCFATLAMTNCGELNELKAAQASLLRGADRQSRSPRRTCRRPAREPLVRRPAGPGRSSAGQGSTRSGAPKTAHLDAVPTRAHRRNTVRRPKWIDVRFHAAATPP